MSQVDVLGKDDLSLSIIVPAFNEEEILEETARIFIKDLDSLTEQYEIVIVDDGSTDRTAEIANYLANKYRQIKTIHHSVNRGVGSAIITGFKEAECDLVMANCADRPFDLKDLKGVFPLFKNADGVIVVRKDRSANTIFRKLTSIVNYYVIRLLFGINVGDFQFVQIYKKNILKNIKIESTDSFVPPELIIKVITMSYRVKEFKATFHKRTGGVPKYNDLRRYKRTLKEMLRFWWLWNIKGQKTEYQKGVN